MATDERPAVALPERLVELNDALLALPPEQRAAVVLRAYGGFSAEEIAALTDTNVLHGTIPHPARPRRPAQGGAA